MYMPKKDRIAIYSYLFQEGAITVQKDSRLPKHHVLAMPNIFVIDALKSLKSRAFVREVFSWQYHYYFLTDEGIAYLRSYLHLDENVVPATLKRPIKPEPVVADRREGGEFRPRREGYRREAPAATA